MKKSTLLAAALMACTAAHADEGMWTLYNLPQAVYAQMQTEGFSLPYSSLYSGENAIKNTVINFSGFCSGVVVSADGLVFTNHHCGFNAIRKNSSVEHDYLKNGFVSHAFSEELPCEDTFVSFMKDQRDITSRLESLGLNTLSREKKELMIDSLENAMTDSVKQIDSTLHVQIHPFYQGNKYYATTYQDFTDVRLVFTVPKSIGKFGGDTDNWMWPRQTCDFSVFRIYADPKTNKPAKYSPENVPYHPAHWAKVSMEGYKPGDFAMTMGYPGSTNRYLSSYGIQEMRDAINTTRIQVRGLKQQIMQRHMRASDAVRIKYDAIYASSANYWKNAMGMNKCIDSIGIIREKQEYETRIKAWQNKTGFLKGQLDFDKLHNLYAKRMERVRAFYYWMETFRRTNEFTTRAMRLGNGMEVKGPKEKPAKQYVEFEDNSDAWDEALDKEVFAALLKNYAEQVGAEYLPAFYTTIKEKFGNDYAKYVDFLYTKSLIMKKGAKLYFNTKAYKKDPGVEYGLAIIDYLAEQKERLAPITDSIDTQEKYLCAAKIRMEEDLPHYSDANFTMRLSYGQVGGYTLNGQPSGYYTTAESLVEKFDKGDRIYDYKAEPVMKEILSAPDFTPYQDKQTGKMQLCFLTNNDITGGNSGSPIFSGKGELLGLAFDGNWDSLSSDIFFDKKLARCIGVDVRFMLLMMDKWGKADRLIKELGVR